jgi:hypothetical protein
MTPQALSPPARRVRRDERSRAAGLSAYLLLTEVGPLLVLSSYSDLGERAAVDTLRRKGLGKFVAYHAPLERVRQLYGAQYGAVRGELEGTAGLRILDFDGSRVFRNFPLDQIDRPSCHEL